MQKISKLNYYWWAIRHNISQNEICDYFESRKMTSYEVIPEKWCGKLDANDYSYKVSASLPGLLNKLKYHLYFSSFILDYVCTYWLKVTAELKGVFLINYIWILLFDLKRNVFKGLCLTALSHWYPQVTLGYNYP